MNRRLFLRSCAAAAVAVAIPLPASADDGIPDHLLAADGWCAKNRVRVYCDGVDLTDVAFECHRGEGWIKCHSFTVDASGKQVLQDDRWSSIRRGKIAVELA